jgi:hypothetical protein
MLIEWVELPTPVEGWDRVRIRAVFGQGEHMFPRGALLRMEDGTVELVGDVNVLGGVCDDCELSEPIVAYSLSLVPAIPPRQA